MIEDLKIVEFASVLAGPAVGSFFAEMGAQVIKIENPLTGGDVTRKWKLPSEDQSAATSAYFASANYGKIYRNGDLRSEEERNKIYALTDTADVIICNWKHGAAEKFKMDHETLRKRNNKIIYAQISGYGEDSERTAYDVVLQAETAWLSMNGTADTGPLKLPVAIIDLFAAHHLKQGILVALLRRAETGNGALVTVNLFDAAVASLANQASNFLMEGHISYLSGGLHPNIAPYGEIMRTHDNKQIILAIGTDRQFRAFCDLLQLSDLAENIKFLNNIGRLEHRAELAQKLQEKIIHFNAQDILSVCEQQDIPIGLIRNMEELFELPHARELVLEDGSGKRVRSTVFHIT